jgi:hypothetical protein
MVWKECKLFVQLPETMVKFSFTKKPLIIVPKMENFADTFLGHPHGHHWILSESRAYTIAFGYQSE